MRVRHGSRTVNTVVLLTVLVVTIVFVCVSSLYVRGAENVNGLYINDKNWYNESKYPLQIIDGVIYIPVTAFNEIGSIVTYVAPRFDVLYIENSTTEKYVSIDRDNNLAIDHNNIIYEMNTYIYSDIIYVPMKQVASLVGLGTSEYKNTKSGYTYYRIYNSSVRLSFKELLMIYNYNALNPEDLPTQTVSSEQVTESETTPKITEPPITDSDIIVRDPVDLYITFEGISNYTTDILYALKMHNTLATFFLTYNDIVQNPATVLRIKAEGHTIALTDDGKTEFENKDDFIEYLYKTNELLSRLIKEKSHIARLNGGCDNGVIEIDRADATSISISGFILWDCNLDSRDNKLGAEDTFKRIKKNIDSDNKTVLLMRANESTRDALIMLLEHIKETKLYNSLPISVYDTEINDSLN